MGSMLTFALLVGITLFLFHICRNVHTRVKIPTAMSIWRFFPRLLRGSGCAAKEVAGRPLGPLAKIWFFKGNVDNVEATIMLSYQSTKCTVFMIYVGTFAMVSVTHICFLQSWTYLSSILCFLDHLPCSCLGSTVTSHTAIAPS